MSELPKSYSGSKHIPTQEILNTDDSPEDYRPKEEQLRRMTLLLNIAKKCEEAGILVVIFGGYGLDGMCGKLTRDHDDIDMLVADDQLENMIDTLSALGHCQKLKEDNKYVLSNETVDPKFKIELTGLGTLIEFTEKDTDYFVPTEPNAILNGQPFRAMTLRGQKEIIRIQNMRAEQNKWGSYSATKRRNQSWIIDALEQKRII